MVDNVSKKNSLMNRLAQLPPEKREAFKKILQQQAAQKGESQAEASLFNVVRPRPSKEITIPLSMNQQGLWIISQIGSNGCSPNIAYNESALLQIDGNLDITNLRKSLAMMISRHEILRTVFSVIDGVPKQKVLNQIDIPLNIIHRFNQLDKDKLVQIQTANKQATENRAAKENTQHFKAVWTDIALEELAKPFDLAKGPLMRITLVQFSVDFQVLMIFKHHIITDGWSMRVFIQEWFTLYQAIAECRDLELVLPPHPIQYADYSIWQQQYCSNNELFKQQLQYWVQQLEDAPPLIQLPTDYPRTGQRTFQGNSYSFTLQSSLYQSFKQICQRTNVTSFMLTLTVLAILLQRYSNQNTLVIGTPIANRNRSELKGTLGFFVNTLALRIDLEPGLSFAKCLEKVRCIALDAYKNQDIPFDQVVEKVNPERNLSHNPIFQVMFTWEENSQEVLELANLSITSLPSTRPGNKFDLTLSMGMTGQDLVGRWEYSADLFSTETIVRMTGHFQELLEDAITSPEKTISQLSLLSPQERDRLLLGWSNSINISESNVQDSWTLPPVCLHQLFELQVQKTPDAIALVDSQQSITFAQLNDQANQLTQKLQLLGVESEQLVPLYGDRSIQFVVGILAILKAGGAYVPLDITQPISRLTKILQQLQPKVMLVEERAISPGWIDAVRAIISIPNIIVLEDVQPYKLFVDNLDNPTLSNERKQAKSSPITIAPNQLAYVLFTSGSTGVPKGVMVEHRHIVAYLNSLIHRLNLGSNLHYGMVSTVAADLGNTVLFPPLCLGGCLHLLSTDITNSPNKFAHYNQTYPLDVIKITPPHLQVLLSANQPANILPQRHLVLGGDRFSWDLLAQIESFHPSCQIWNHYGPTEAVVGVAVHNISHRHIVDNWQPIYRQALGNSVPIGQALAHTQLYVLDTNHHPVPTGVPGELYIGGSSIARGYFNQKELTTQQFIQNPFRSGYFYKTGDLVRYQTDDTIEYLGRLDDQVKIRGFRIELGEIEGILSTHPQVHQTVVICREDVLGNLKIVAYVTSIGDQLNIQELRQFLKQNLPSCMLPSDIVKIDALPLTANGKLNRKALPEPSREQKSNKAPLQTNQQHRLASLWAEILSLKTDCVGLDDDFFDLGGHSILAIQLMHQVQQEFGITLSLRSLFEASTLAEFDRHISINLNQLGNPEALATSTSIPTPQITPFSRLEQNLIPLSWSQERLWVTEQLEGPSPTYNMPGAMRLRGTLKLDALQAAFDALLQRHESLRTSFLLIDSQPVQVISSLQREVIEFENWTQKFANLVDSPHILDQKIQHYINQEGQRLFQLDQSPLVRVTLLQLAPNDHVLIVVMHHIISDGWSIGVFLQDLSYLYAAHVENQPVELPSIPIQYADYAYWQRQHLEQQLNHHLGYWRQQLADAPAILPLPTDYPRPKQQSYRGEVEKFSLSSDLVKSLKQLSQESNTTLFMALLAGFKVFLYHCTGQNDIVIGTDTSGRDQPELNRVIGFFINLLPLRTKLSGNPTFRQLLERVRNTTLDGYDHQMVPFDRLVRTLVSNRDPSYSPIIQVLFVFLNFPTVENLVLPDLDVSPLLINAKTVKFDLTLFVEERQDKFLILWNYCIDLFKSDTIRKMHQQFEEILMTIIQNPDARINSITWNKECQNEEINYKMSQKTLKSSQIGKLKKIKRKALKIDSAKLIKTSFLSEKSQFPLVVQPSSDNLYLKEWIERDRISLQSQLLKHGAILFRSFKINSVSDFEIFAELLCPSLFGDYGDLPPESNTQKVYGATPYPADKSILFHNESSHQTSWPMCQFFYCSIAPETGGETPIVDCRKAYQLLSSQTRQKLDEKQIMYVRNFIPGLDVSWQDFYKTTDRVVVEDRCRQARVDYEWYGENSLRTRTVRPAIAHHPTTGDIVFFNQIQLHHIGYLDNLERQSLDKVFTPENLPRNVYYGDGSPIEDEVIEEIRDIYNQAVVSFTWQSSDVLMLDNMLTAHGRYPYTGNRKISVAMGEMYHSE